MFELSHLVPNLNEIVEEYAEGEEDAVQETQPGAVQEKERSEARTETEQLTADTRKRKRGVEEAEIEQRNERVRYFISDKAFVLMEKSLKDKGFIIERGFMFNKLISPFIERLKKRGWQLLGEHKALGFVALVKGFYANIVGVKGRRCVLEESGYLYVEK